jgi:hypothetical protein
MSVVRIANAQGFWGDDVDAAKRLLEQAPDLDYLTLDYLAEVSMSIMAVQRQKDQALGYARDFVEVVRDLVPHWKAGSRVKVVTNAGGLNPAGCAQACAKVLADAGLSLRIGVVSGDDVLAALQAAPEDESYRNLETGEPLEDVLGRLGTANAYLGAQGIVECLEHGADIVLTGRVADPSLVVAPAIVHHGWRATAYDAIAGATVAGHIIECGRQACGGIATNWLELPDPGDMGFPIVEIDHDGSCTVTKPTGTGGRVSVETVKEQLLYELGDPAHYLSPDAMVSFLGLRVEHAGKDRVRVAGARGAPPPEAYKVSATYRDGFTASGMLTIFGRNAAEKARRCGRIILDRVAAAGYALERHHIECLGATDVAPGVLDGGDPLEVVLRVTASDSRREAVERFTKEFAPLVTSGPQGVTGYATGRPKVRPVFGYWPCLIRRDNVTVESQLLHQR